MTYAELRERVGHGIALYLVQSCGIQSASMRQLAAKGSEMPPRRRLCVANAADALAKTLTELARDLRAEDEP